MLKHRIESLLLVPIWYASIGQGYANVVPGYITDESCCVSNGMTRVLLEDGTDLTYTKVVSERVYTRMGDAVQRAQQHLSSEVSRMQALRSELYAQLDAASYEGMQWTTHEGMQWATPS